MSKKPKNKRAVTIFLEPEDSVALDQWAFSFNLDNRAAAALCIFRAGIAAVPLDTAIFEVCAAAVRETRKAEFLALEEFHTKRAQLYQVGRTEQR